MEQVNMFLLGTCTAIIYCAVVLPSKHGDNPAISLNIEPFLFKGMIIFPISEDTAIHLHHWIIYGCLLAFYNWIPIFLWAFFLTLTIQGIFYEDAFIIFVKNPWKKLGNIK